MHALHTHTTHTHSGVGQSSRRIRWPWCEGWMTSSHNSTLQRSGVTPHILLKCSFWNSWVEHVCVRVHVDVSAEKESHQGWTEVFTPWGQTEHWRRRSQWSALMRCSFDLCLFDLLCTHITTFKETRGKLTVHTVASTCMCVVCHFQCSSFFWCFI